jgi:hypothetical protein
MTYVSDHPKARTHPLHALVATLFCVAMTVLGHLALGPLVALVFGIAFFGGLAFWLARPMIVTWARVRIPYFAALAAYVIHRIDEEVSGFVPAMEDLAGRQAADLLSAPSILLVVLSLAWMLSPLLVRKGHPLGHFGAWSLFAAFALVEPWHFIFPILTPEPYGYFPGMITAPIIIAVGAWGLWSMWAETRPRSERESR